MTDATSVCWCGGQLGETIGEHYARCTACGTAVLRQKPPAEHFQVRDDTSDFYGKRYWTSHMTEDYGFPGIDERSRTDLTERVPFWMARILEYVSPDRSYLEIGCGHGGSVYMMQQLGFDATGIEMSPWVLGFAKERFGIDLVQGPAETSSIEGTYGCIASFDVLEHVEDPVATIRWCREHLVPDGTLFLQTPSYRGEDATWSQFRELDHIHLFTEGAIRELLDREGFRDVKVSDSLFPYDMWVVASSRELPERKTDRPVPPVAQALLDLTRRLDEEARSKSDIDQDRHRKQDVVDQLVERVEDLETDRTLKADVLSELSRRLDEVSADRKAKAEDVDQLHAHLAEVETDRRAKAADVDALHEIIENLRAENEAMRTSAPAVYEEPRVVSELDECVFYHSTELPGFGLVEGQWDLRGRFDDYVAGVDVQNKRLLDVGTASGFLSFEAERRGAEVVSFDAASPELTTPLPIERVRRDVDAHNRVIGDYLDSLKNSYWLSHRLFESRARVHYGNILSLPESLGTFDVVLIGQILTHLRDPLGALSSLAERCGGTMIIVDAIRDTEQPMAHFVGGSGEDTWAWWHLSFALYRQFLGLLGFEIETVRVDSYPCLVHGKDVGVSTLVAHRS